MILFDEERAYYNIFRATRRRASTSKVSILDLDAAKSTSFTDEQRKAVESLDMEMNDPRSPYMKTGATRASVFREMFWRPPFVGFWKGGYPFETFVTHENKATDSYEFNFRPEFYGVLRTYDEWMSALRMAPELVPPRVSTKLNLSEFAQHAANWIEHDSLVADEEAIQQKREDFRNKVVQTIALNGDLRARLTTEFDRLKRQFVANDFEYETAQTLINALEERFMISESVVEKSKLRAKIDEIRHKSPALFARTERLAEGRMPRSFKAPKIKDSDPADVQIQKNLKADVLKKQEQRLKDMESQHALIMAKIADLTSTDEALTPQAYDALETLQNSEVELNYHIVLLKYTDYDVSDKTLKAIVEKDFKLLVGGDVVRKLSSLENFIIYNDRVLDALKSFVALIGNPNASERRSAGIYGTVEATEDHLAVLQNRFGAIVTLYRDIAKASRELEKDHDAILTDWALVDAKRSKLRTAFDGRLFEYFSKGSATELKCCCCVSRLPPPPATKKRKPEEKKPEEEEEEEEVGGTVGNKPSGTLPITGAGFYFDTNGKSAYVGFAKQTARERTAGAGGPDRFGRFIMSDPAGARTKLAHVEKDKYYLNGDTTKEIVVFLEDAKHDRLTPKQIMYYNTLFDVIAVDLRADTSYELNTFGHHVIPGYQTAIQAPNGTWTINAETIAVDELIVENALGIRRYFPIPTQEWLDVLNTRYGPTEEDKNKSNVLDTTINPANPGPNEKRAEKEAAEREANRIRHEVEVAKAKKDTAEAEAKRAQREKDAREAAAKNFAENQRILEASRNGALGINSTQAQPSSAHPSMGKEGSQKRRKSR